MTISSADTLRGFYNATKALGTKSISSDAYFEIEGHADLALLTKQFPWPTLGSQGEIEVSTPLGGKTWMGQQIATAQQGPITFTETIAGRVMRFMEDIVANGGEFNATVYEGTPDKFTRAYKLVGCFFVPDAVDRDWENRSQLTLINGTLFYNFFGGRLTGNDVSQ
jgi:hypothetical protein